MLAGCARWHEYLRKAEKKIRSKQQLSSTFVTSDLGGMLQETKTTKEKAILNSFRKKK